MATNFTIALITFMVSARHEGPTRSAISPAFTNGFLVRRTLWFAKHVWPLKCLTLHGILTSVKTRRARHTIATRLVAAMCGFTRAQFVTCITHKPLRHRARYIPDHVIVLFDIVEQINSLLGVDLAFGNYVFTCQALINGYLILPKMFLEFD